MKLHTNMTASVDGFVFCKLKLLASADVSANKVLWITSK
jgi:hypothetical protein